METEKYAIPNYNWRDRDGNIHRLNNMGITHMKHALAWLVARPHLLRKDGVLVNSWIKAFKATLSSYGEIEEELTYEIF